MRFVVPELPAARDRGQDQRPLEPGEMFAHTDPRATPEGEVAKLRPLLDLRGRPPLRVEARRRGPPPRVAMREVLAQEYHRSGGEGVAAGLELFGDLALQDPRRREETHRFR